MLVKRILRIALLAGTTASLAACGGGIFGSREANVRQRGQLDKFEEPTRPPQRSSVFDMFESNSDPNTTVEVNKYIWQASLDILNFLPVESVDPFSGVIVTGYGTPPGGGRAYRATIYVTDPALDARSLKVALQSRNGAVDADTVRAVEDAILTRARELRIRDSKL